MTSKAAKRRTHKEARRADADALSATSERSHAA
jgi:hypothetical protein